VERPPHYDTFAEFQYAYHYGDIHCPYIKQDEPLKTECQHFLDCIRGGTMPITGGAAGMEVVQILEASTESLRQKGAPVSLTAARYHRDTAVPFTRNGVPHSAAQHNSSNGGSHAAVSAQK
jgi:hypothetical protein